jgi:hypothetical protein
LYQLSSVSASDFKVLRDISLQRSAFNRHYSSLAITPPRCVRCPSDKCHLVTFQKLTVCMFSGWMHECTADECPFLQLNDEGQTCPVSCNVYFNEYSTVEYAFKEGGVAAVDNADDRTSVVHIRDGRASLQYSYNIRAPVHEQDPAVAQWQPLVVKLIHELCDSPSRQNLNTKVSDIIRLSLASSMKSIKSEMMKQAKVVVNQKESEKRLRATLHFGRLVSSFFASFSRLLVKYDVKLFNSLHSNDHKFSLLVLQTANIVSTFVRYCETREASGTRIVYSRDAVVIAALYLLARGVSSSRNPAQFAIAPWPRLNRMLPPLRCLAEMNFTTCTVTNNNQQMQLLFTNKRNVLLPAYEQMISTDVFTI